MEASGIPFISCLNPQSIVNPYTKEAMKVPCGKCAACKARQASRYTTQIQLEAKNSWQVLFVTLTYANSCIPTCELVSDASLSDRYHAVDSETGEVLGSWFSNAHDVNALLKKVYLFGKCPYLRKADVQKFMKRLRKMLSKYGTEKIRYFLCGEYGPVHFRPHFHILLFLKSSEYSKLTEHTLKDFPQWTWQNSDSPDPVAKLSVIEYCVRSCWKYGSIDAAIPKGDCASYVASYVNGFGNLPKVFRFNETKPFTAHSKFLGCEFLKDKREEVYSLAPSDFVHNGFTIGSFYKEFDWWRSCTNVFFPKCKGYASKTARERMFTYRLYLAAREAFPETPLMDASLDIVLFICRYFYKGIEYDETPVGFSPVLYLLCRYFKVSLDVPNKVFSEYTYEEMSAWQASVYRELCLSRHFLTFVCNGDYTQKATGLYYRKIEEFYNYLDQLKLSRWYENMQVYFMKDYACDEDIVYFFDNVGLTDAEVKSSYPYQLFAKRVSDKTRNLVKHKYLNDLNAIFNNV